MIETSEILLNHVLYHEWVTGEIITVIEKSKIISEEILPHLNHTLETHNYWLSIICERKHQKTTPLRTVSEISKELFIYHEEWRMFITSLKKEDFSRLVKITNATGLIQTHSLIDLIIESFRVIENEQSLLSNVLENNYRKRLRLGFLDYRQRINRL